jgi:transcriptional regulator with XRE-family HTH domain
MLRALTQEELAERVGTKQPSIARLESGKVEPRLSFLRQVVETLGGSLLVRIVPREESPGGWDRPSGLWDRHMCQMPNAMGICRGNVLGVYTGTPNAITMTLRGPNQEIVDKEDHVEVYHYEPGPFGSVRVGSRPDLTMTK